MNKIKTIEKLVDTERDFRTHIWTALVITISGTLSLMYSLDSYFKKIFFLIGFIISIVLLAIYLEITTKINLLTRKLLEAENEY